MKHKRNQGMTMVEVVLALAFTGLLLAMAMGLFKETNDLFRNNSGVSDAHVQARSILARIVRPLYGGMSQAGGFYTGSGVSRTIGFIAAATKGYDLRHDPVNPLDTYAFGDIFTVTFVAPDSYALNGGNAGSYVVLRPAVGIAWELAAGETLDGDDDNGNYRIDEGHIVIWQDDNAADPHNGMIDANETEFFRSADIIPYEWTRQGMIQRGFYMTLANNLLTVAITTSWVPDNAKMLPADQVKEQYAAETTTIAIKNSH